MYGNEAGMKSILGRYLLQNMVKKKDEEDYTTTIP